MVLLSTLYNVYVKILNGFHHSIIMVCALAEFGDKFASCTSELQPTLEGCRPTTEQDRLQTVIRLDASESARCVATDAVTLPSSTASIVCEDAEECVLDLFGTSMGRLRRPY